MADEKVNMGPEENKTPETLSPPGQGDLPPLEENNAPAVSGEDKAAPDHVEPDPPSADKHTADCSSRHGRRYTGSGWKGDQSVRAPVCRQW